MSRLLMVLLAPLAWAGSSALAEPLIAQTLPAPVRFSLPPRIQYEQLQQQSVIYMKKASAAFRADNMPMGCVHTKKANSLLWQAARIPGMFDLIPSDFYEIIEANDKVIYEHCSCK